MGFRSVGRWWNDKSIELVEIDDKVYALGGWNGESYSNCWICTGDYYMEASEEEYTITPIYNDSENQEVVSYTVVKN